MTAVEERFWAKVDRRGPNDCWEWKAGLFPDGYGVFNLSPAQRNARAHRVAWQFANNQAPPRGLNVCHECDNPPCCNPGHLWLGTQKQNMHDMARKGRLRSGHAAKTHCPQGHPYSPENTYRQPNVTRRHCRECVRAAGRRYREKAKAS